MAYLPSTDLAVRVEKSITMGASASQNLFTLTGSVLIKRIWGVVTEATTGNDCTAVYFDVYSANGSDVLTKNDGVLSDKGVGAIFWKAAVKTVTMSSHDADATPVLADLATSDLGVFEECMVTADASAATTIRLSHTTASCDIDVTVFCDYVPLSADGALVAA